MRIGITCGNSIPTGNTLSLAAALGSSKEWVKKWLKRFREELAGGVPLEQILQGHSRARKSPPAKTHAVVVEQILAIRDHPPEGLRRVRGPEAIRYYLEREPLLQFFQLPVPSGPRPLTACSQPMSGLLHGAGFCTSRWSALLP